MSFGIFIKKKMNRRKDMVANLRSKAIRWLLSNFANRDSLLVPEITPDAMSRTIFFYYLLMPVTASKLGRLLKAKPPYVERNVVAVVSIKYSMQNAVAFEAAAQQIRMGHAKLTTSSAINHPKFRATGEITCQVLSIIATTVQCQLLSLLSQLKLNSMKARREKHLMYQKVVLGAHHLLRFLKVGSREEIIQEVGKEQKVTRRKRRNQKKWFMSEPEEIRRGKINET